MKGSEGCLEELGAVVVVEVFRSGLLLSLRKRGSVLSVLRRFISDAWGREIPPFSESGREIVGGVLFMRPVLDAWLGEMDRACCSYNLPLSCAKR